MLGWLRAAASACWLARCCPAAGVEGLGTSAGTAAAAGALCADAFLMPTVVHEPLSGEPLSVSSISDETENPSAKHLTPLKAPSIYRAGPTTYRRVTF